MSDAARYFLLGIAILIFISFITTCAEKAHATGTEQYSSASFDTRLECDDNCPQYTSSAFGAGYEAAELITLPDGKKLDEVRVIGQTGCSAPELRLYGVEDGLPGKLFYQRPMTVTQINVSSVSSKRAEYRTDVPYFVVPGGDLFASVYCTDTDASWGWAATAGAGAYRSTNRPTWRNTGRMGSSTLAIEFFGAPTGGDSQLRAHLRGNDTLGWAEGQIGPSTDPWNRRIEHLPVNVNSAGIVATLAAQYPNFFQINMGRQALSEDFAMNILEFDASTPKSSWTRRYDRLITESLGEDQFFAPDCDSYQMPLPVEGRINDPGGPVARLQNEAGYTCTGGGDCRLLMVNPTTGENFDQWKRNGGTGAAGDPQDAGGCMRRFDFSQPFDEDADDSCSSATAAGLPYLPYLVTPGECAAGNEIEHAVAFVMNNSLTENATYFAPAKHNPLFGQAIIADPMPYGSTFRVVGSYDETSLTACAAKMVRAGKRYGFVHIDGSNPAFMAGTNDALSLVPNGWDNASIALTTSDLISGGFNFSNLELVSIESTKKTKGECTRRPTHEF